MRFLDKAISIFSLHVSTSLDRQTFVVFVLDELDKEGYTGCPKKKRNARFSLLSYSKI